MQRSPAPNLVMFRQSAYDPGSEPARRRALSVRRPTRLVRSGYALQVRTEQSGRQKHSATTCELVGSHVKPVQPRKRPKFWRQRACKAQAGCQGSSASGAAAAGCLGHATASMQSARHETNNTGMCGSSAAAKQRLGRPGPARTRDAVVAHLKVLQRQCRPGPWDGACACLLCQLRHALPA